LLILKSRREQKMGTFDKEIFSKISNNSKFQLLQRSLQFLIGMFPMSILRDLHHHKDGSKNPHVYSRRKVLGDRQDLSQGTKPMSMNNKIWVRGAAYQSLA
jgi:hypothetical protein